MCLPLHIGCNPYHHLLGRGDVVVLSWKDWTFLVPSSVKQKCPRPSHTIAEVAWLPDRPVVVVAGRKLWAHTVPWASELSCFSASFPRTALGSQGEHRPCEACSGMAGICLHFCRPGCYVTHSVCPHSCEDQWSCCCFRVKAEVLRCGSMAGLQEPFLFSRMKPSCESFEKWGWNR